MSDGKRAAHLGQQVFRKDVGHSAHRLVGTQDDSIGSNNPRRLLSAMLQSVQPQVSQLLGLWMGKDGNHSALVVKFVRFSHRAMSYLSVSPVISVLKILRLRLQSRFQRAFIHPAQLRNSS